MHELGIMTGVLDSVCESAKQVGAERVLSVSLSVGEMTECIHEALQFAFEALRELPEYGLCESAELEINMIAPRSLCYECGEEYDHDRFHMLCPKCGGFSTTLLRGRELQIDSIEVDIPDEEDIEN